MGRRLLLACLSAFAFSPAAAFSQATDTSNSASTSVLTGIVKDEYGEPLANAEIILEPSGASARTDSAGKFRISAPARDYNVVFRNWGYLATDFSWRAVAGVGTELSIRLDPVPYSLDTVVVLDKHNRVAGTSKITGTVLDDELKPVSDVELQLMGSGRHASSQGQGEFFFYGLAPGTYIIRARRLGFSPGTLTLRVGNGSEHEVAVKLTRLPTTLTTVEVREQSGFGKSAIAWDEFDRRQRWRSGRSITVTREDFGRLGKMSLDWALRFTRASSVIVEPLPGGDRPVPTSINPGNLQRSMGHLPPIPGEVCVLINGVKGDRRPLSWFTADEVDRVEVVAENSDLTGTIAGRMGLVKGCEGEGFRHPRYYVIWLRGADSSERVGKRLN